MTTQNTLTAKLFAAALMCLLLAAFVPFGARADSTVAVTPVDSHGWLSFEDTDGSPIPYDFVAGPASAPLGNGSARFVTDENSDRPSLGMPMTGVQLSDITTLTYRSYQTVNTGVQAVALQFNVDANTTDGDLTWQGRLVYEPYYTHEVKLGEWQTWNTLDNATAGGGVGNWWFSNGTLASTSGCDIATPCTWAEIMSAYPNAGLHPVYGMALFKAGSFWPSFDGNVDAFELGIGGDVTTYDFEPFVASIEITSPLPGTTVNGLVDFTAVYNDEDGNDPVDWAVRKGTCAANTGTVAGNVDGYHSTSVWNGHNFSASVDMSMMVPGEYCFVFNPREDAGDANLRATSVFYVEYPSPTTREMCFEDGWVTYGFKNQGQCVRFVETGKDSRE